MFFVFLWYELEKGVHDLYCYPADLTCCDA